MYFRVDRCIRIKYISIILITYFIRGPYGKNALHVHAGIIERVDGEKCVGCGKCAAVCPAAVITIVQREVRV